MGHLFDGTWRCCAPGDVMLLALASGPAFAAAGGGWQRRHRARASTNGRVRRASYLPSPTAGASERDASGAAVATRHAGHVSRTLPSRWHLPVAMAATMRLRLAGRIFIEVHFATDVACRLARARLG